MTPIRALFAAASMAVAGCSGVPSYPDTLAKNLHVTTLVDSGGGPSTVAEFDIHRLNARCETEHLGRVYLDNGTKDVGLPVDAPIYLDFIFASKGFLSPDISAVRHTTLFTARSGYDYSAQVRYVKGIYSVVIREARQGVAASRVVERVPLSDCKQRG
jgi:hypothetical protein